MEAEDGGTGHVGILSWPTLPRSAPPHKPQARNTFGNTKNPNISPIFTPWSTPMNDTRKRVFPGQANASPKKRIAKAAEEA